MEARQLLDAGWHNELRSRDVNDDGLVTPIDVLVVVNAVNSRALADSNGRLLPITPERQSPPYVDVNNDGFLTPTDALIVVNAFTSDRTAPSLHDVHFKDDRTVHENIFSHMPVLLGRARDDLTGALAVWASVDGGPRVLIRVSSDGSFEFGTERLGELAEGSHRMELVTGDVVGNMSPPTMVEFAIDRTNPTIERTSPNRPSWDVDTLSLHFSEAIDRNRFSLSTVSVVERGPDREFGTPDDFAVQGFVADFTAPGVLQLTFSEPLKPGSYRVQLDTSQVTDLAGNSLEMPVTVEFASASLIGATATLGMPRQAALPSANTSQRIGVDLPNADEQTRLNFAVRTRDGELRRQNVAPVEIGTDQVFFLVPENAVTGDIFVSSIPDPLTLQVVPTLRSVTFDGSHRWQLGGTGLYDRQMTTQVAGQPGYSPKPTEFELTDYGAWVEWQISGDRSLSGPIVGETPGGKSNDLFFPGRLSRIRAVNETGTPADPSLPSANAGQLITIEGQGFTYESRLHFPIVTHDGRTWRQMVLPKWVNDSGTELAVVVPMNADTGPLAILGADIEPGLWLQVVPVISAIIPDDENSIEIHGSPLAGKTRFHVGSITIIDDNTSPSDPVRFISSDSEAIVTLPVDNFSGPVRLETPGGISAPWSVNVERIESTAFSGTPADPSMPSANAGQVIKLHGSGFHRNTAVFAAYRDQLDRPALKAFSNISVSPDGSQLLVQVPSELGGVVPIRVIGSENSFSLQIVPVIDAVLDKDWIIGSGFVEASGSIYASEHWTLVDDSGANVDLRKQTYEGALRTSVRFHGQPPIQGFMTVTTSGGRSNARSVLQNGDDPPPVARLEKIEANAIAGVPHSGSIASANQKQAIVLVGTNFSARTEVLFPLQNIKGEAYLGRVNPAVVDPDGTRMQVVVPEGAVTGDITVRSEIQQIEWRHIEESAYAVYRNVSVPFRAEESRTRLSFKTHGLSRQWGLDNVRILSEATGETLLLEDFEGGPEHDWKVPSTNEYGRGYLTEFLGPLFGTDQTLVTTLISGESYQLIFDFLAFDPAEGPLRGNVPAYAFSVFHNGEVAYRHPFSLQGPVGGRLVEKLDPGSVALQIVPTITSIRNRMGGDPDDVAIYGSGFVEGDMQITMGGIAIPDRFAEFDLGSIDGDVGADWQYIPSAVAYFVSIETNVLTPITVVTAGGSFEFLSRRTYESPPVDFMKLEAVALRGEPGDPTIASANVGQTIRLTSSSISFPTIIFDGVNELGVPGEIAVAGAYTSNGTVEVVVPQGAKTGFVRLAGDSVTKIPLQIVPTLDSIARSQQSMVIEGSGFTPGSIIIDADSRSHSVSRVRRSGDHRVVEEFIISDDADLSRVTVVTEGGRFTLVRPTASDFPLATYTWAIEATANSGTPRWSHLPSAVVGQTITLIGQNLGKDSTVLFRSNSPQGFLEVAPVDVSDDGSTLTVVVPEDAISGGVKVSGESGGTFLQVVPTAAQLRLGTRQYYGIPAFVLGSGFVQGDHNRVHLGDVTLTPWFLSSDQLRLDNWPSTVPPVAVRIETLGGISGPISSGISRIEGVAQSGVPAKSNVASANAGQTITLYGHGLHDRSMIRFAGAATTAVTPSRVVSDREVEVVVPLTAETGPVFLVSDETSQSFLLQIVPTIEMISATASTQFEDASQSLILNGTGLFETALAGYFVGEEPGYTQPFRPSPRNDRTALGIPLHNELPLQGPITVTTSGGTATYRVTVNAIDAVAESGIPHDSSVPSANVGQTVTVHGENLGNARAVVFRYLDSRGFWQWISATPLSASEDGSSLQVEVPKWTSGVAEVLVPGGQPLPLQVVPVVKSFQVEGSRATVHGTGFVEGNGSVYDFHDTVIVDESTEASATDVHKSYDQEIARMSIPVFGEGRTLRVTTLGGTSEPYLLKLLSTGRGLTAITAGNLVVENQSIIHQVDPGTGQLLASYPVGAFATLPSITDVHWLAEDIPNFLGTVVPRGSLLVVTYDYQSREVELLAFSLPSGDVVARMPLSPSNRPPSITYDTARKRILISRPLDIIELDPATGAQGPWQSPPAMHFPIYNIAFDPTLGNLWVRFEDTLREYTPLGRFLRSVDIPKQSFSENITGFTFDSADRPLVSTESGLVYEIEIPDLWVSHAPIRLASDDAGQHDTALLDLLEESF